MTNMIKLYILLLLTTTLVTYYNEFVYKNIFISFYYNITLYLSYLFFMFVGYLFNIYYGSCHWKMISVEDMYMIVLNDFYGSKCIFIQKNNKAYKTIRFNYNLNEYTLMKRVQITLTDNVKKVLEFIKED